MAPPPALVRGATAPRTLINTKPTTHKVSGDAGWFTAQDDRVGGGKKHSQGVLAMVNLTRFG